MRYLKISKPEKLSFFDASFALWFGLLFWTYSFSLPQAFDDWKSLLFYAGCATLALFANPPRLSKDHYNWVFISVASYLLYALIRVLIYRDFYFEGFLWFAKLALWTIFTRILIHLPQNKLIFLIELFVANAIGVAVITSLRLAHIHVFPQMGELFVAPIGHITFFSDVMAVASIFALFLGVRSGNQFKVHIFRFGSLLIFFALWTSGGRASLLTYFVALTIFFFFAHTKKLLSLITMAKYGLGVLLIILFSVIFKASIRPETTLTRIGEVRLQKKATERGYSFNGTTGRSILYERSLKMSLEKPLWGWGLGTFQYFYPKFKKEIRPELDDMFTSNQWLDHPHSEILHQSAELGVVGLFLFISVVLAIALHARINLKLPPSDSQLITLCGLSVVIAITLVSWQLSTNFIHAISRLALSIGAAMALSNREHLGQNSPIFHDRLSLQNSIAAGSLLFLVSHYASLSLITLSERSSEYEQKWSFAKKGLLLAPESFEALYIVSTLELRNHQVDTGSQLKLFQKYSEVPVVIFERAINHLEKNELSNAKASLRRALLYDKNYAEARDLLDNLNASTKVK
ncbi:O-antigen ligase family protein [bacterium]|nr:O-antigen ligase family protein [bacterium]